MELLLDICCLCEWGRVKALFYFNSYRKKTSSLSGRPLVYPLCEVQFVLAEVSQANTVINCG